MYSSKILSDLRFIEMLKDIKSKNPGVGKFVRLLQLDGEDLSQGNLKNYQR